MTGRAADLVGALVPGHQVPALGGVYSRTTAIRRLAFDVPWSAAVLTYLETLPGQDPMDVPELARRLACEEEVLANAVEALEAADLIVREQGAWRVAGALTVDAYTSPQDNRTFKRHWAQVAEARIDDPGENDQTSINLFAVSSDDMARIRELQRAFYREVRSIVAASEPSEEMGLLVVQLRSYGR